MSAWRKVKGLFIERLGRALTPEEEVRVGAEVLNWIGRPGNDVGYFLDIMEDRFRDRTDLPEDPVARVALLVRLSNEAAKAYHQPYEAAGKKPLFPFILALPNGPPLSEILACQDLTKVPG